MKESITIKTGNFGSLYWGFYCSVIKSKSDCVGYYTLTLSDISISI